MKNTRFCRMHSGVMWLHTYLQYVPNILNTVTDKKMPIHY